MDFLFSFKVEVNWFPEFASVALSDARRTEVNPKVLTEKPVRELLNQDIFCSEIDVALALISQCKKCPDKKGALKASAVGHTQLSNCVLWSPRLFNFSSRVKRMRSWLQSWLGGYLWLHNYFCIKFCPQLHC